MIYKVENLIDSTYQVISSQETYDEWDNVVSHFDDENFTMEFQGSLADCNAWLMLNDKGYMS